MPTYEGWPIETDPTALALDSHAYLGNRFPGYRPSPANFDSATIDAHARMAAEVRDLAANMPDEAFLRVAAIAGMPVLEAAPATLTAIVTAVDTLGYVLPAGTVFGLRATGDVLYLFEADDDVTVPAGSLVSAAFTLTAQEDGAGPNDLGGLAVDLVIADRTLPWLAAAATASTATGGVDAELVSDSLNRLVRTFRRRGDTIVLPDDFASRAIDDPAVARAYAIDRYLSGVNERQTIGPHDSTGGQFTLTFEGQTTSVIAFDVGAVGITSRLESLSNVDPGDVTVTGGPLPGAAIVVEFTGALGESNRTQMTANATGLTGGTDTMPIVTTQAGAAPAPDTDRAITVWVVDEDGEDPGEDARERVEADLLSAREAGFLIGVRAPAYVAVDVTAAVITYPEWDVTDVQSRVATAIQEYLSPSRWGIPQPAFGDPVEGAPWYQDSVIRQSELIALIENVDGVWRMDGAPSVTPTIEGVADDFTMTSFSYEPVLMPTAGTVTVTASAP